MADNNINTNQKVYTQTDINNILLVDPNKVVNPDGTVEERLVNHEELVMYANLEAKVLPRTKLAVGETFDDSVQNLRVAELNNDKELTINFMGNGGEFLDTTYTDQITGSGALQGQGINQKQEISTDSGLFKKNTRTLNKKDTQLLGITRISIKMNTSYVPQITIEMIDVQGKALFEQGENSPYSAFVQLPYPIFTLTIKGYYGKAVRYELMLTEFNAKFDPSSGNYLVTTNYIGRNHALLSDVAIGNLYALPFMYPTTIEIVSQTTTQGEQTQNSRMSVTQTTRGRQKLDEVYRAYEAKGLIPENFPRLSLSELDYKLENFYRDVMKSYGEEDMSPLKSIANYQTSLSKYVNSIYKDIPNSWFRKYVDKNSFIILKQPAGAIYFQFKKDLNIETKDNAITELNTLIVDKNKTLTDNPVFGINGRYIIDGQPRTSEINVNITKDDILKTITDNDTIDFEKTFKITNPTGTQTGIESFKTDLINKLLLNPTFIFFGDAQGSNTPVVNSFLDKINTILNTFNTYSEKIQQQISIELANKIKTTDIGIGFEPTIQNMLGVICANTDAFLRLMDDVHEKAWDKRDDPTRVRAILTTQQDAPDAKNSTVSSSTDGQTQDTSVVYPWPYYFEKEIQENGKVSFYNKYPGSLVSKNYTNAVDFSVWPEVEFIEQYVVASTMINTNVIDTNYGNETTENNFVRPNAIEFPFNTTPYADLTDIQYLYEIFERSYLSSNYTKLFKENGYRTELYSAIGDIEYKNIEQSVNNSPTLLSLLKNFRFDYSNFILTLRNISNNGQGVNWSQFSRDIFVTPYIKNYIEKDFEIYSNETISTNSPQTSNSEPSITKIKDYLKKTESNELSFLDTYPFTDNEWLANNLSKGDSIGDPTQANTTIKSLEFYEQKKLISSFTKPITNFEWLTNTSTTNELISNDLTTHEQVIGFYRNRIRETYVLTEAKLDYGTSYDPTINNVVSEQTTSLLNTPYFINSLLKGVEKERNCDSNPYVSMGYIVLNSLPLATLREKSYKYNDNIGTELDYLYATLNKFSAIHELPYLWVLKYGSIWHRYKKKTINNVEILDDVWEDFNYLESYDPITSVMTKNYQIKNYNGSDYDYKNYEQTGTQITINNGLYPKTINDVYYYFTKTELISDYNTIDWGSLYTNKKLMIGNLNDTNKTVIGYDPNTPTNQIKINNWFQYLKIESNTDFDTEDYNKVLLFPSLGGIKFNQAFYECFKPTTTNGFTLTQPYTDSSVYNGTVRTLWGAPNYGYFNNGFIRKPQTNEYIKVIDPKTDKQNSFNLIDNNSTIEYSNIEEIFSVFTKEMLDEFENHFLNFCEPNNNLNKSFVKSNLPKNIPQPYGGNNDKKLYDYNLESFVKSLLIVDTPELTNNPDTDSKLLSGNQLSNFSTKNRKYLLEDYNIILKIGNPGKFNRYVYDSFSNNNLFHPVDRIVFGTYIQNTLPTNGGSVTLQQSINQNQSAWEAMKLYVGDFTDNDFIYSDNGSYLTDFFVDMDIEFNENNVKQLSHIVKIYATKKKQTPTITPTEFYTLFNTFMEQQLKFQTNILNHVFLNLNKRLPIVNTTLDDVSLLNVDGDQTKNELYETFKKLNDKWIAGQDFKSRTIFEDFLIMDRAGRPARDIIIDIEDFRNYLAKENNSKSVFALIGSLIQKNNFVYIPTPVYVNFYGVNVAQKNPTPPTENDVPNAVFGTFMSVDVQDSRPKFLIIYVDKPSEYVDQKTNPNYGFNSDAFDISIPGDNTLMEDITEETNLSQRNRCVAFNVDFGTREQGIFKSISLDMSQRRNTAPTFQVLADLGNQSEGQRVAQQSASLYEFYKSQSYTCQVTSMGNAMIQPTMYFNLRHVPMFYGPYLIISVSHEITPGDFTTQFEGVRIPKFALSPPDKLVTSINKTLIEKYISRFATQDRIVEITTNPTANIEQSQTKGGSPSPENECKSVYPNLPYLPLTFITYKPSELYNTIDGLSTTTFIKKYIYGLAKIQQTGNGFNCNNNNLFNILTNENRGLPSLESYTNGQFCSNKLPYASFEDINKCISYVFGKVKNIDDNLTTITNDEATAYAQYYILLWKTNEGYGKFTTEYSGIINNLTEEDMLEYNKAIKIFEKSITEYDSFC